jgi:hypothetical protein
MGLANALARAGSAGVIAISELSAADLMASMSPEQKAELTASLQAAPANADAMPSETKDTNCSKCGDPMKDGKCKKCSPSEGASAADAVAAARAEERARFSAVMSSEHYKGNEGLASTLLATDKLSADEIITALASAKPASSNAGVSAEEAARSEMRAAMLRSGNSNIDAGNGGSSTSSNAADYTAGWKKAAVNANSRFRL